MLVEVFFDVLGEALLTGEALLVGWDLAAEVGADYASGDFCVAVDYLGADCIHAEVLKVIHDFDSLVHIGRELIGTGIGQIPQRMHSRRLQIHLHHRNLHPLHHLTL